MPKLRRRVWQRGWSDQCLTFLTKKSGISSRVAGPKAWTEWDMRRGLTMNLGFLGGCLKDFCGARGLANAWRNRTRNAGCFSERQHRQLSAPIDMRCPTPPKRQSQKSCLPVLGARTTLPEKATKEHMFARVCAHGHRLPPLCAGPPTLLHLPDLLQSHLHPYRRKIPPQASPWAFHGPLLSPGNQSLPDCPPVPRAGACQ